MPFNSPQDSHNSEYLSDSPHLAFVFRLAPANSPLHCNSIHLLHTKYHVIGTI